MDLSPLWDFCRHTGSLLVAMLLVGIWLGPRVDLLLAALVKFIAHTADLKPQLDEIAETQKNQSTVCRFEAPSSGNVSSTAPASSR